MRKVQLLDWGTIIERMEDKELDSHLMRAKNYPEVINALQEASVLETQVAERLIVICYKDLNDDLQFSSSALLVISLILKKVKEGKCGTSPILNQHLLHSALTIVNKTKAFLKKAFLRKLAFETLFQHPDEILRGLAKNYSEALLALIDFYPKVQIDEEVIDMIASFVFKILSILSHEDGLMFVKQGLKAWFNSVIPGVVVAAHENPESLKENIKALELLVEYLVKVDYAEFSIWQNELAKICDVKMYPAMLKGLVERKNDCWHRLWIIFIKLLKDQITKVNKTGVSPINGLLPVVELAFKLDPDCRCRAFQCWNVLIDNFSSELNETIINKRLKLLIIPLKLNNAKVEQTVLAKFDTWWHLIRKFHNKLDKHTDSVLIPFLHFCFGKKISNGKSIAPGQINSVLGQQSLGALVEIVGHVDCDGCVELPKLNGRLISSKLLVDHWSDWVQALTIAIKSTSTANSETARLQLKCLWKGLFMVVAELAENQIRADLVMELLKVAEMFLWVCKTFDAMKTVFDVLVCSLFDEEKIIQLLKSKNGVGPIHVLLKIIRNSTLHGYFVKQNPEEVIAKFKPITKCLVDSAIMDSDEIINNVLIKCNHTAKETKLLIWGALAEVICEYKHDLNRNTLFEVVVWPLLNMNDMTVAQSEALWYRWYTLYSYVHPLYSIDENISKILCGKSGFTPANKHFVLCASIASLKQKLVNFGSDKHASFDEETEMLLAAMIKSKDYEYMEQFVPILMDTLHLLLMRLVEDLNLTLATNALKIVNLLLKHINQMLRSGQNVNETIFVENIIKPLDAIFQLDKYSSLIPIVEDELCECIKLVNKDDSVLKTLVGWLKMLVSKLLPESHIRVLSVISAIENPGTESIVVNKATCTSETKSTETAISITEEKEIEEQAPNKIFTTPEPKSAKKAKIKEPNIVNTVVENGEEFVVVKSHWKFNPKKLTENQKEKFQRKREDIPALYQDLSQSQDGFKLTTWKTDSQDASSTASSKSESNSKTVDNDVTTILKSIPSTDVVPKIIKNIFIDNANKDTDKAAEKSVVTDRPHQSPTVKDPKTPRLALKDRVFRNVKNLIQKSGAHNEVLTTKETKQDMNQTVNENNLQTPVNKVKTTLSAPNSAPPTITTDRPLRSVKIPKKYENTEIYAVRKRKRSPSSLLSDLQPHVESFDNIEGDNHNQILLEEKIEIKDIRPCTDEGNCDQEIKLPQKESFVAEPTKTVDINSAETPIIQHDKAQVNQNSEPKKKLHTMEVDPDIIVDNTPKKQTPNKDGDNCSQLIEEITTPKPEIKRKNAEQSTIKKKRSRIEKQLLIDMVEGHPLLQQSQSEKKRVTRKNFTNEATDTVSRRRKSLIEKSNKIKAELENVSIVTKKSKEKDKTSSKSVIDDHKQDYPDQSQTITIVESQEHLLESSEDVPMSEDVIESSQDSTLTTISVKSSSSKKKLPIVKKKGNGLTNTTETQKLLDDFNNEIIPLTNTCNEESKDDIELPRNKTKENVEQDLTEDMDTEPIDSSGEVIIINEEISTPVVINSENTVGKETQELAEADTLPVETEIQSIYPTDEKEDDIAAKNMTVEKSQTDNDIIYVKTQEVITPTLSTTAEALTDIIAESSNTGSPTKDEIVRKEEFLNNTIEISPIKTVSPLRENKSISPETSSEYVVIKLTSPVQSNGEPFIDKCDSPEIFTEEKVSPDKRDHSPPRKETTVPNSSPSSSLSLKKNRPTLRFNGRAGQMLGLCVPDMNSERSVNDEGKKGSPMSSHAKRNLRKAYTSGEIENQASDNDIDESEKMFLKFTRSVPTADCSPAGPILKRKLAEIIDEATVSPLNKRKRVSFHDPPVSTTVAVQKYIEPCSIRSPSNSAIKRQERQTKALTNAKSPKRLDSVFKLETILTKAVESFSEDTTVSNDTVMSLDETPAVEVIKTSELNDTDPICADLLECKDPIENIATELSSPSTKELLIKELEGKVETVADIAKMTELEVNRLCIKAPKIQVAKKVLSDYAIKKAHNIQVDSEKPIEAIVVEVIESPPEVICVHIEVQTDGVMIKNSEVQTVEKPVAVVHTQTESTLTIHTGVQTKESGSRSTKKIVAEGLKRPDFIDQLVARLDESSIQRLSEKLPFDAALSLLLDKMDSSSSSDVLNQVLNHSSTDSDTSQGLNLKILQDYLFKKFDAKKLLSFTIEMLQKIHDKPA